MDANNVPFWQFRGPQDFGLDDLRSDPRHVEWCAGREALVLADLDSAPELTEDEDLARLLSSAPSCLADSHGGFAWWNPVEERISASGFAPGAVSLLDSSDVEGAGPAPDDLAHGDDIVFVARGGKVAMVDLRERWPIEQVEHAEFDVSLITATDGHAPWLLDTNTHRLARLEGTPLPSVARSLRRPGRFEEQRGKDDPNIVIQPGLQIPEELDPVAMRISAGGQLAILCWNPGEEAEILLLHKGELQRVRSLSGLEFPTSLAWSSEEELCVVATDGESLAGRVFAYDRMQLLAGGGSLRPNGRYIPLLDDAGLGLANHSTRGAIHIATRTEPTPHRIARRLAALSRAARSTSGSFMLGPIDGQVFDCCWHRFYAEAKFPEGCGARIALYASNRIDVPEPPSDPASREGWALHLMGAAQPWAEDTLSESAPQWPLAAWCHSASEIPGHRGFCPDTRESGRSGLFTCLAQDGRRAVRRVTGRYLYVHVELTSNGRATPELYALRMYGDRFSYTERYLPEIYGETLTGEDAQAAGSASPPDFLERFVHLMEGPMSEMEARVANGWLMTDPAGVPDDGLDWLGSWTGQHLSNEGDPVRKRQKLLAAPHLARMNGTAAGLAASLELETGGQLIHGGIADPDLPIPRPGQLAHVAIEDTIQRALVLQVIDPRSGGHCSVLTGGDVSAGRIVAVEGFRLRRTMGTILGRQLADPEDPLLPGRPPSGNSVVGDSLILGEKDRAALLSYFSNSVTAIGQDRAALADFYRALAHTVLIMVRRDESGSTLPTQRILEAAQVAAPAHVQADVLPMSAPFIAGVASLIGIDSFLANDVEPGVVTVGEEGSATPGTALGRNDRLVGSGSLDQRGDVPAGPPPVARADGPASARATTGFVLDASRSRAASGRNLNRFIWTWN